MWSPCRRATTRPCCWSKGRLVPQQAAVLPHGCGPPAAGLPLGHVAGPREGWYHSKLQYYHTDVVPLPQGYHSAMLLVQGKVGTTASCSTTTRMWSPCRRATTRPCCWSKGRLVPQQAAVLPHGCGPPAAGLPLGHVAGPRKGWYHSKLQYYHTDV